MTNKSHLFQDKLKVPGYLSQLDVTRIRKSAESNTEEDFKEFFGCTTQDALRILGFWEVSQVELWDAEILKRFFHVWIYEDRNIVASRIHAAQKTGRLPDNFTAEIGLKWLESENVLTGMIPQWVRANARQRDTTVSEQTKPLQRAVVQDGLILAEIRKQGYDPLALPKNQPGKPGVKAAIRAAVRGNSMFIGTSIFDAAWERLTKTSEIVIKK